MDDKKNIQTFQYTYSAREQEEIKKIRNKYVPREENKIERLRRLDAGVSRKAEVCALCTGIIGALIFGAGMSMCLTRGGIWFALGIIVGIIGIIPVAAAFPVYHLVTKRERQRIALEIIRLTDELMK